MTTCRFGIALLVLSGASLANAEDSLVGKRVFPKEPPLEVGRQERSPYSPSYAVIVDDDGEYLDLGDRKVRKSDVMLAPQAIEYYTEQIRTNPSQLINWRRRADKFQEQKEFAKAIEDYDLAAKHRHAQASAFSHRAAAWLEEGELDNAIEDSGRALECIQEIVDAYTSKAECFKDFNKILDCGVSAAYYELLKSKAHFNRGAMWHRKGELDKALHDYDAAIELDEDNALAFCNRGLTWISKHNYAQAIEDCTVAIRIKPKLAMAYIYRGEAKRLKGEHDDAATDLEEAVRLAPTMRSALVLLTKIYATCPQEKIRNGTRAVELGKQACELSNENDETALEYLAAAHAEVGNFTEAIACEQKAIDLVRDQRRKGEMKTRLKQYQQNKPFRDAPNNAPAIPTPLSMISEVDFHSFRS